MERNEEEKKENKRKRIKRDQDRNAGKEEGWISRWKNL